MRLLMRLLLMRKMMREMREARWMLIFLRLSVKRLIMVQVLMTALRLLQVMKSPVFLQGLYYLRV